MSREQQSLVASSSPSYASLESFHTYESTKEEMDDNEELEPLLTRKRAKKHPSHDRFFTVMFSTQLVVVALLVVSIVILWVILQSSMNIKAEKHTRTLLPRIHPTANISLLMEWNMVKPNAQPSGFITVPTPCCSVEDRYDLLKIFVGFATGTFSNWPQIFKEKLSGKMKAQHQRQCDVIDSALRDIPKSLLQLNGTFLLVRTNVTDENSFKSSQYVLHCTPTDITTVEVTRYSIQGAFTVVNSPLDQLNISFIKNLERSSAYGVTNYTFDPNTEVFQTAYSERLSNTITFSGAEEVSFNHLCTSAKFYVDGTLDQKSYKRVEFDKVLDNFDSVLNTVVNGYDLEVIVNTSMCSANADVMRMIPATKGFFYHEFVVINSATRGWMLLLKSSAATAILRPNDNRLVITSAAANNAPITCELSSPTVNILQWSRSRRTSFSSSYTRLIDGLKVGSVEKIIINLTGCTTDKRAGPFGGITILSVGLMPTSFRMDSTSVTVHNLVATGDFQVILQAFNNDTFTVTLGNQLDLVRQYRCASMAQQQFLFGYLNY